MGTIALRPVEDADLDALFEQMRDPESVRVAAFTPADPDDRAAFDAHLARVRTAPDGTHRAIPDHHLASRRADSRQTPATRRASEGIRFRLRLDLSTLGVSQRRVTTLSLGCPSQ